MYVCMYVCMYVFYLATNFRKMMMLIVDYVATHEAPRAFCLYMDVLGC